MTDLKQELRDALQVEHVDIDYNKSAGLQGVIMGDGLDFDGKIIDTNGVIVCDVEFGYETILPPTTKEFIEAYLYSVEHNMYVLEAICRLSKERRNG